jgi:hypothetical protein
MPKRNVIPRRNHFEVVYYFGKHGRWSQKTVPDVSATAAQLVKQLREAADFVESLAKNNPDSEVEQPAETIAKA